MISWPGAIALLLALLSALLSRKLLSAREPLGHNAALDGFRGYLAFGVFLHHAVVWFFYLHGAGWGRPPPGVYQELGLFCVDFFFMITAFLFVGKLIDGRSRPVDWLHLYLSRLLRIVPLYLLAVTVLCVLAGVATHWTLNEPVGALLVHVGQWLLFDFASLPAINGYSGTPILISFVIWSLKYEWLFYLSLPVLAALLRVRVPLLLLAASAGLLLLACLTLPKLFFPFSFVLGAVVAAVVRAPRLAAPFKSRVAGAAALSALAALLFLPMPHLISLGCMLVSFCTIASGNGLFGLLTNRAAVELGEASYGIYLLHGLVLSGTLLFVVGADRAARMDAGTYWLVAGAIGVVVAVVASTTYCLLELPLLRKASPWTKAWRRATDARVELRS